MEISTVNKIVLTGGGTAGHVIPHLALLPSLRAEQWQVVYIGSATGIEKQLITAAGVRFYAIASGKLRRYFSWRNFSDAVKVGIGVIQSFFLLLKIRPHIVFSKGGYVSVPVAIAAFLLRIKVVTHESDFSPGLATRIISKFATEVWAAFTETQRYFRPGKCFHTGIPIRAELHQGDPNQGRKMCKFRNDRPTLMIIGGSLGSQKLNTAVAAIISELIGRYQVIHILGVGNAPALQHSRYRAFPFIIEGFNHLLSITDMVAGRAGANSIFEFLALQIPMLLIPLSAGSRGDQIQNANCFAQQGFALVLSEKNLRGETLLAKITELEQKRDEIKNKQKTWQSRDGNGEVMAGLHRVLGY